MRNDNKTDGEESEIAFALRAIRAGFSVSRPFGDSSKYDCIVDHRGKLSRIQVKSTSRGLRGRYKATISSGGKHARRGYSATDVDYLAIHIKSSDTFYIIPVAALSGFRSSITLVPELDAVNQFNQYDEAWHQLLNI